MADRRLQVFWTVAKHLSFTRAAETLHMTQPAVTFQILQLEQHFQVRLFDRVKGRVALTEAGRKAFAYADRAMAISSELETCMKEMKQGLAGPLQIGASTTIADYFLPPVLADFKTKHPRVILQLSVGNSEDVQARVLDRTFDVGFIEGESHLASLLAETCCEDELRVVCAPSHDLARRPQAVAKALNRYLFIRRESGSGTREVVDSYLRKCRVPSASMNVAMEVGSPEAIKRIAASGIGFAIMSRAAIETEAALGTLVGVPLVPRLRRRLTAVFPKEKIQSRLVETFLAFANARLKKLHSKP